MNTKLFISSIFLSTSLSLFAQKSATITLHTDQSEQIIPKEIYGQFAEHLGTCIYGGLWVGEKLRYSQHQRLSHQRIQCTKGAPCTRPSLARRLLCR